MDHLEAIKSRLTIEDVVGQYVSLHKAGRNYKALCPFHNEKTPSFIISPDKGLAYCFGCQQGGDIFKFVELVERCSFPEAVKLLAEKAGVALPNFSKEKTAQKEQTLELNETAACFFTENLNKNAEAKKYLLARGLNEETIRKFRLGYAPDSFDATYKHLLEKGFTKEEIARGGLAIAKDAVTQEIYDRFRNRIMFPITNVLGKVIAFGGRIFQGKEDEAKYLNSPDSPTYNKSLVLYALEQAKENIRKTDQVVLVEGYMDVITAHQAGFTNVVASSGTALTTEQIKLLKRYTQNFLLAFDSDTAGRAAGRRALELVIENEANARVVTALAGKDPDECIRQDVKIWEQALKNAVTGFEFIYTDLQQKYDLTKTQGKKEFLQEILMFVKKYASSVEQDEHLKLLANKLKISEKAVREEFARLKTAKNFTKTTESEKKNIPPQFSREKYLLGLILNQPEFVGLVNENLIDRIFLDAETKRFYKFLKNAYNPSCNFNSAEFFDALNEEEKTAVNLWQIFVADKYRQMSANLIETEIKNLIQSINKQNLAETKKELIFKLKEAKMNDPEEYLLILNQYNQILKLSL